MDTSTTLQTKTQTSASFASIDFWMIFLVTIWGANFVLIKSALTGMNALVFGGLRFTLAAFIMLGLWRALEGHVRIARADILKIVLLGIVGNTVYQLCFVTAIKLSTASNTSLIVATSPIWVALLGTGFRLDQPTKKMWLGIFLSIAGLYLIISSSGSGFSLSDQTLMGDLLMLCGAIAWGLYTLLARPVLKKYSSLTFTTWSMVAGGPLVLLAGVPDLLNTNLAAVSWTVWAILIFSAVFALSIGYIIWNMGVHRLGQSRAANYVNVSPIISMLMAAVFLGEPLTVIKVVGAAVVLVGLTLTRRG
jgi:drug/metabolite transporter (DMT)-like permease